MKIELTEYERKWIGGKALAAIAEDCEVDPLAYATMIEDCKKAHRKYSPEECAAWAKYNFLHLATLMARKQAASSLANNTPDPIGGPLVSGRQADGKFAYVHKSDGIALWLWRLAILGLAGMVAWNTGNAAVTAGATARYAATGTSQIDFIEFLDAASARVGFFVSPFRIKAGSNITFSRSGTTLTITGGAGGSGCIPAGSSGQLLFDDGAGGCTASSATVSGSTITATLTGNVTGNLTGNVTGNVSGSSGSTTGNAATATALASNPADCSANQFANTIAANGDLSCAALTLAGAQFANQGTTTTLLHGNAAGNPSFSAVISADLNITTTSCTNQFVTAIGSGATGTCTTATLASAQFANQGTTTTVLHGNAAGNPSFGAIVGADMTADTVGPTQIDETVAYALSSTSNTFTGTSYTGPTADPADTGILRASNDEKAVCWEASAAGTDVCLQADASEIIQVTGGTIDAADLSGTLATARQATDAKVRVCEYTIGAPGTASPALADDNDLLSKCRNKTGSTLTVTAIGCYANAGSPTVMVTVTGGSDTLTGNLTCGTAAWAAGSLSGTPTVASDGSLDLKIVSAGGTAKSLTISVAMTL